MPANAVSVEDLRKTYRNGVEAVRGLNFAVEDGEIFGVLGPNGAGKSTTMGILTTSIKPTSGRATVAGHDVVQDPLAVRRATGVVFQESVLDNDFSGLDNMRLHARLWGLNREEAEARTSSLLGVMGLSERAGDGVRTYSGGMKRRLEIARALLGAPRVLFLDEPTAGLDPAIRVEIWDLIQRLRRSEGVTILLSTHYLEEAEGVCNRVAIVHKGQVVALDSPGALLDSLGPEILELRVDGEAQRAADALAVVASFSSPPILIGDTLTMPVTNGDGPRFVEAVRQSGASLLGTTIRRPTLNDVFMQRTGAVSNGPARS